MKSYFRDYNKNHFGLDISIIINTSDIDLLDMDSPIVKDAVEDILIYSFQQIKNKNANYTYKDKIKLIDRINILIFKKGRILIRF